MPLSSSAVNHLTIGNSQSEATRLAEEVGKREKYVTVLFNNAGCALLILDITCR